MHCPQSLWGAPPPGLKIIKLWAAELAGLYSSSTPRASPLVLFWLCSGSSSDRRRCCKLQHIEEEKVGVGAATECSDIRVCRSC